LQEFKAGAARQKQEPIAQWHAISKKLGTDQFIDRVVAPNILLDRVQNAK
jgi:hypothetical protein